jgi:hypothetical protein
MSVPAWHEEPISKKHDRKSFDCGDPAMNEFFERYALKAMNLVPRRPFSQLTTQTTRAFLVSTAWLRALWPTLTRRRRLAAAWPVTMCPGSGSRGLLHTCVGRAKV